MKRRRFWLLPVLALFLGLAFAYFLLNRYNFLTGLRPTQPTRLGISSPSAGQLVPLHSTLPVVGEANSALGVRSVELWINSQKWGEERFDVPQTQVRQVWAWTPSGEGKHVLLLRAVDALGQTLDAGIVEVYATADLDVTFPVPYTSVGGETLSGLAASYGTDPQSVADSNPGFDPNAPLPPGQQLTIPVPVPNADPVTPGSGQQPVPPAAPLPGSGASGAKGPIDLSIIPAFEISPSEIVLKVPVQQVYAYVSLGGQPWFRLPADEFDFLPGSGSTFDLKPYLTPEYLAGLPSPISFDAHVWGWGGGALVYLGHQTGVLDSTWPQGRPMKATSLSILGQVRDTITYEYEWNIPSPVPDYYHGFNQAFQWTTTLPGVTGAAWQISTVPFGPSSPLVDSGTLPPPNTVLEDLVDAVNDVGQFFGNDPKPKAKPAKFSLDFSKYVELPPGKGGLGGLVQVWQALTQPASGLHRSPASWPQTFFVRVIPIMGNQLGEPSNVVVVHYGPPEAQPVTDATGPLFDVELLSFTPYRAPDPNYLKCSVANQDIPACPKELGNCGVLIAKGTQSCGCPGVSCSKKSSSSCGLSDPLTCVEKAAEWGASQLEAAVNWASEAYADAKKFAVDTIMTYTGIEALCDAAGGTDLCRQAVELAVDYGLAAMGLPPTIPNFDQLMSQGEDYLVEMAVQELKDQGLPCDAACESAIKAGYDQVKNGTSSSGSGGGAPGNVYVPHPLAVEQPAIMSVRVTRRPETTGIPDKAASTCSLIVWNGAVNPIYGVKLEGAPFSGLGMKIPLMQPGESVTIPVVLTRIPWYPPAGFSVKSASGQPIQGLLLDPVYGAWTLLYYGSTITFDLRSQGFNTPGADGQPVYVKCMDNFKYQGQIPVP